MNYYEHHLGDWAKKCSHLNATEEGIYRRLLDWYYAHERPLPITPREVCRLARCTTPNERKAVQRILSEFFEPMADGWHQSRADRELERYEKSVPATHELKRNLADRQARSRKRRQSMFDALREKGVVPSFNATNYELMDMCRELGIVVPQFGEVPRVMSPLRDGDASVNDTAVHIPNTNNQNVAERNVTVTEVAEPGRIGLAARAIKKAGLVSVNPGDPRFTALIEAGATDSELAVVATEATLKGKGWAWFLATVKGRREDAARAVTEPTQPQQAPQTYRQRAAAATVQAWVPQLAAKPPARS